MVSSSREQEEAENSRESSPSAPKSTLTAVVFLKFLKILTKALPSLVANLRKHTTYILEYTTVHDSITGFSSPLSSKRIEWPLLS